MINAIINGIFNLIISMFETLLSPFISAITILFPSVTVFFNYITTFLAYSLTYSSLVIELFLIPRAALVSLFDYFAVTYSIYLISLSIKFAVNIYNKFKI